MAHVLIAGCGDVGTELGVCLEYSCAAILS
jgi:hypothetical protein